MHIRLIQLKSTEKNHEDEFSNRYGLRSLLSSITRHISIHLILIAI